MIQLRPADLILVHGSTLIDRAIEDIEHSLYSHAAGVGFEPGELIEARGFRATGYQNLGAYQDDGEAYVCNRLTDTQRTAIVDSVKQEIGKQYDYLLLIWELYRYVLHMTIPFKEPFHSRICSTLWADAYKSVGVDLCPGIRYPSPGDIAQSALLKKVGTVKETLESVYKN